MMTLRKGAALRRPWLFSLGGYYYAVRANRHKSPLYSPEKVKKHE